MRAALAILAAVAVSPLAHASTCCESSHVVGLGRLAPGEAAAVTLGFGAAPTFGWWDERGSWSPDARGATDLELRASLLGVVAIHERLELSAKLPWLINHRTAEGQTDVATGPADASLALRWAPITGVGLTAGASLPLGRSTAASRTLLGSDATTRGVGVLFAAITLEQQRAPWLVQLGIGAGVPLPAGGQQFGPSFEASVTVAFELTATLQLQLMTRLALESARRAKGVAVPDSDAFELALGPSVSWRFHDNWTWLTSLESGIFAAGLGDNRQGRVGISTALRCAFL